MRTAGNVLVMLLCIAVGGVAGSSLPRSERPVGDSWWPDGVTRPATYPDVGMFPADGDAVELPAVIDGRYRARVRSELAALLAPRPMPAVVEAAATGRPAGVPSSADELDCRWWALTLDDGQTIRAGLVQARGRAPAPGLVMMLHGHGSGIGDLFRPDSPYRAIARELADDGSRVLVVETRGFGNSPTGGCPHIAYVNRLRLQGREFHGQVLSDNRAVLTWALATIPDARPVTVGGLSLGGVSSLFLGAVDPRPATVLVSGAGGSWRHSFASSSHCPCSIIPGLLRRLDSLHLFAAMEAGRVGLELGRHDYSLGVPNTADLFDDLRAVADRRGAELWIHQHDGGHVHHPAGVVAWLAGHKGDAE